VRPKLYYSDHYEFPLPEGHRFPIRKYAMVRQLLSESGHFHLVEAPFAERKDIELAHDPEFVEQFLAGTLPPAAMRRIGFPWSEGLVRRSLGSAGATVAASDAALKFGWGGSTSGGTHHAFRAAGSGFCVFNDFAIAINRLRATGRIRRAAIIDLDVHQGDGTAEIFQADTDVLTTSIHCKVNFPFRKQQSNIDVELEVGIGDEEYLRVLDHLLPEVLEFEPEIIFYQAGVDGLASDTLGKLSLTEDGLRERDRRVFSAAIVHGIPLVITLGGGYSEPIELTAQAHANTYLTAVEVFSTEKSGLARH
jgi:acetoin utilization deacetylase AcuC-like enzyme